jgi:MerR family copper efflux transcriptional regulator
LQSLRQKTRELMAMTATLEALVSCCHGDERPDCPILATLAEEPVDAPPSGNAVANRAGGATGKSSRRRAQRA